MWTVGPPFILSSMKITYFQKYSFKLEKYSFKIEKYSFRLEKYSFKLEKCSFNKLCMTGL
jgi:hypothetical protein